MTRLQTERDARRGRRLKDILGDKTKWTSYASTKHPGRTAYNDPHAGRTVVVGRRGRVRSDVSGAQPLAPEFKGGRKGSGPGPAYDAKPGSRLPGKGSSGTGGTRGSGSNDGAERKPTRTGSEGRKWGAFVNTESGDRQGKRFNVVTRNGQQFNVYADGTAIKNTTGTKGYARASGYRDVNENTGRSGKVGGGRQDWHRTTLGTTSATPQTPAQKAADVGRDTDWDARIKAAREARRKRQAANA